MRPVDHAARASIADDLEATLFVEAGAGTGKTTALVERVVSLVRSGVPIGSIAAITFTEAAAAELRDRIRADLAAAAHSEPGLSQAVADLDGAAISTLHAFAYRILSEHPVEAGLPPRLEILDEVRSQLAFEERWDRFVDELMSRPDMEGAVVRAARCGVAIEARTPGQATLKDIAQIFEDNWDRLERYVAESGGPLAPVDASSLLPLIHDVLELPSHCSAPDECKLVAAIDRITPALQAVVVAAEAGDEQALIKVLFSEQKWKCANGQARHWSSFAGEAGGARSVTATLEEERGRLRDRITRDVLRRLGGAVAAATVAAAAERTAEGRLEFHDLLVLARRLVRTSEAARTSLHERYERLLLDEFQDTDPIQIELAASIAASRHPGGDRWQRLEPEPGRLFLVGDAKQSIYRFRRADIEVFRQARETFGGDATVELSQNFRTVPAVIEAVNGLFGDLMAGEGRPRYSPLAPERTGMAGCDHRPIVLGGPHDDEPKADELRAIEAAEVASVVADIVARPDAWPVCDDGTWRAARPDDVTILIPARTSLARLREALEERNVPHRADTGTLIFDSETVRELLAVLTAVADPTDQIALVSALRSPLFGCGDDDLWRWRHEGGRWDVGRPVPDDLAETPVGRAMTWLAGMHEERWWREPSALLERIARERRAFELAFAADRPRDAWRRIRYLIEQARQFEESEGGDVRDFLAWAELQRREASSAHEPVPAEADDRSVRIMTIHGAKGLEFPITVVSGLTTQLGRGRSGPTVLWGDDGPEIALKKAVKTDNFDRLADFEGELDQHERTRLLYVALTRAKDHLVVSGHHLPKPETHAKHVWTAAQDADLWRTFDPAQQPPVPGLAAATSPDGDPGRPDWSVRTADERQAWVDRRSELVENQRQGRSLSATAVARLGREDAVDESDPALSGPERPVWRRGRAGTAVGRAVHSVLETVDLATGAAVDQLARAAAAAESLPDAAPLVAAKARSALASSAVADAVAAPRSWRELYVAAPLEDGVLEGYIDLLYEGPHGLVVVDYKTDEQPTVDDKYRLQGAAYAVALERSTGLPVAACRFVFARDGDPVEHTVDDLDAAKAEVLALVPA